MNIWEMDTQVSGKQAKGTVEFRADYYERFRGDGEIVHYPHLWHIGASEIPRIKQEQLATAYLLIKSDDQRQDCWIRFSDNPDIEYCFYPDGSRCKRPSTEVS